MTSEESHLLIPQYLSGQLTTVEKEAFEAHLAAKAELRAEVEELRPVWQALGALPDEQPSPAVRARFYQKLNAITRDGPASVPKSPWWKIGKLPQFAIACVIFILGISVGHFDFTGRARSDDITQMRAQLQSLREMFALSLLDRQQSATSRLQGVSWSSHVEQPDGELLSALLRALNHDPNVNVRLSALDALEKYAGDRTVRKAMLDAIPLQDSPLVQISLIDALVHIRDNSAAIEFKKLTVDTQLNPAVRERAKWALQQLGY